MALILVTVKFGSLKKYRALLNMNDDQATILDMEVTFHHSTSRHYYIDILPVFFSNGNTHEVFVSDSDLSHKQKLNQLDETISNLDMLQYKLWKS